MTINDIKEVTEVAKDKLKEKGDVYSKHILAYISYLEKQIEKMKCCQNCKNKKGWKGENPCLDCKFNQFGEDTEDKWELVE